MKVIHSKSENMTEHAGEELAKELKGGSIVELRGEMGAGKTAFARGIARGLGFCGRVTSPTYAIVNEYDTTPALFHFDLYRLSGADELFDIGFYEYLERDGICVMEWLSRADGEVAPDIIVTLSYDDDENTRLIEIEKEAK